MPSARSLIIAIVGTVLLWSGAVLASGAGWNLIGLEWDFERTGQLGDSFGPISTFMAALAALAALSTFKEQKAETERLRERERVEDTRREEAAQAQDALRQKDEAEKQQSRQEGTFFQLLATFQRVTADTDIKTGSGHMQTGRDAFLSMLIFLNKRKEEGASTEEAWAKTFKQYHNDLAHYFRLLYTIVRFVDSSNLINKGQYIRIIRSLLSESELALLAYNCAFGYGRDKFKPFVEKFALLHSLSDNAKDYWRGQQVFGLSAFGD